MRTLHESSIRVCTPIQGFNEVVYDRFEFGGFQDTVGQRLEVPGGALIPLLGAAFDTCGGNAERQAATQRAYTRQTKKGTDGGP